MSRQKTTLTSAPPYEVSQALIRLGGALRTARLRRNLTIEEDARKLGSGKRAVARAESGAPGTAAAACTALLWTYDLLNQLDSVADPALDTEGLSRVDSRERAHGDEAPSKRRLDNDF